MPSLASLRPSSATATHTQDTQWAKITSNHRVIEFASEESNVCCQILLNYLRYFSILLNTLWYLLNFLILLNTFRNFWIWLIFRIRNILKFWKVLKRIAKYCKVSQSIEKYRKVSKSVAKYLTQKNIARFVHKVNWHFIEDFCLLCSALLRESYWKSRIRLCNFSATASSFSSSSTAMVEALRLTVAALNSSLLFFATSHMNSWTPPQKKNEAPSYYSSKSSLRSFCFSCSRYCFWLYDD